MKNPWEEIPLSDYENHMSFETVGQLQCLNSMMKAQFNKYPLSSVMILGAAGGNGLEHIEPDKIQKVYAVDINPHYLEQCKARYAELGGILECICLDLTDSNITLPHCELITADLLIEYIGLTCFQRVVEKIKPICISCIIQADGEKQGFVSNSPYIHVFDGLNTVHSQIGAEELKLAMKEIDYRLTERTEQVLPNGKKLVMLDFAVSDKRL